MNQTAYDRVIEALYQHRRNVVERQPGRDAMAQCPGHDDGNPSLHVTAIEGSVLLHCFGPCSKEDVQAALGMTGADMFDDKAGATYRYDDGRTVRRSVDRKTGKKRFRQTGATKASTLYRLARLQAIEPGTEVIHLVEGEKDVHAIEAAGGIATTAPQGASNFDKVDPEPLRGHIVIAVVDNDGEAGLKWAGQVREKLGGVVASLGFVQAAAGKDAADHIAAGWGLDEFLDYEIEDESETDQDEWPAVGEMVWDGMGEAPDDMPDAELPATHAEQAEAIAEKREEIGGDGPDAEAEAYVRERFPSVDWTAAFATDWSRVDWLPGRFMERGQQISLVGDGKAGKSLFALEWSWRSASGRPFLGDLEHEPIRVLYLDKENSPRDLITRALSLGAEADDLAGVIYKQFPRFSGTLDAPNGKSMAAKELVSLAQYHKVDVVIIDTISRFIGGKENDSETWLQVYSHVHEHLKRHGIACIRLDHFGKDDTRGSRGSSAKTQDVDHVWELGVLNQKTETENGIDTIVTNLRLHRTHTRTGLGRDDFAMTRTGRKATGGSWLNGQTAHELTDPTMIAAREIAEHREIVGKASEILAAGYKGDCTRRDIQAFCKAKGITGKRPAMMSRIAERISWERENPSHSDS